MITAFFFFDAFIKGQRLSTRVGAKKSRASFLFNLTTVYVRRALRRLNSNPWIKHSDCARYANGWRRSRTKDESILSLRRKKNLSFPQSIDSRKSKNLDPYSYNVSKRDHLSNYFGRGAAARLGVAAAPDSAILLT